MDPSLALSSIKRSRKCDDGVEFIFKTRYKDATVIADVVGSVGVALKTYLKKFREKFTLEPYL